MSSQAEAPRLKRSYSALRFGHGLWLEIKVKYNNVNYLALMKKARRRYDFGSPPPLNSLEVFLLAEAAPPPAAHHQEAL